MNTALKVTIIDYGVGNVYSVANALERLNYKVKISRNAADIKQSNALILPGVGAYDEAMKNLRAYHLQEILNEEVVVLKKPILGICLGMQMLADGSHENGWHTGLGWIKGQVKKLELPKPFSVPHVGWNNVSVKSMSPLFSKCGQNANFYFDHSYHFECEDKYKAATCEYGSTITVAVAHNNISGVQCHPERSQVSGLKLFRSFLNSV